MGSEKRLLTNSDCQFLSQNQYNLKMSAVEGKKVATKKVEAPAKKTTVPKARKSAGAKKGPKAEAKKLTYLEMVTEAIKALKDRSGSSRQVITRYIFETHKVDAAKVIHIRKAIAHGIEKGILKQARASGKGAGSFRVVKEVKPEKTSKPKKKPVAKKVVKASSAGASSIKKNLQKKTIKKVAPKKVVKKAGAKTTKPVKKPSTAKKAEKPAKKQAVPSKKTKSK